MTVERRPVKVTWKEFEAATPDKRRTIARKWITTWEENYRRKCQLDTEADQRAFAAGFIDEPSIDKSGQYAASGTTRSVSK